MYNNFLSSEYEKICNEHARQLSIHEKRNVSDVNYESYRHDILKSSIRCKELGRILYKTYPIEKQHVDQLTHLNIMIRKQLI